MPWLGKQHLIQRPAYHKSVETFDTLYSCYIVIIIINFHKSLKSNIGGQFQRAVRLEIIKQAKGKQSKLEDMYFKCDDSAH